jgi:hypothetical protein
VAVLGVHNAGLKTEESITTSLPICGACLNKGLIITS